MASTTCSSPLSISHCHTTNAVQPSSRSRDSLRRSLATFASNFLAQKFACVFGIEDSRQPSCRCQKHPCTKTTILAFEKTRSGVPGSESTCSRYRSPARWSWRLRRSSGAVFILGTARMIRLRVARSTESTSSSRGPTTSQRIRAKTARHRRSTSSTLSWRGRDPRAKNHRYQGNPEFSQPRAR